MATDSTELTFVRCPSCRSLVPAVSTRCRMCGAGLEGVAKPNKAVEEKTEQEDFVFNDSTGSDSSEVDPLSAYIEEVAEPTPEVNISASPKDLAPAAPMEEDPLDIFSSPSATSVTNTEIPAAKKTENSDFKSRWAKRAQVSDDAGEELMATPSRVISKPVMKPVLETPVAEAPKASKPIAAPTVKEVIRQEVETPLFGFLISYINPKGEAIELREGKFFITASSLKANDLVINHPSISTPHALFNAVAGNALLVQDLVSDSGVHVKTAGATEYLKIDQATHLQSGDWVKLGDLEYLLVLVP